MSEEDEVTEVVESEEPEVVEEPTDTDPIEALAVSMGYNPDWQGDESEKVSAEEYIKRTDRINRQASKDIRELKQQLSGYDARMQEIAVNSSRQMKAALDSQKARLTEERNAAVEVGDTERFNKIQTEMDSLASAPEPAQVDPRKAESEREEAEFKARNPWYKGTTPAHRAMTTFALQASKDIGADNPNMPIEEYFQAIEDTVKYQYAAEFANPSHKPTQVSPTSSPKAKGKTVWDGMLAEYPEAKDYFNDFVADGTYKDTAADKEKYAKEVMA